MLADTSFLLDLLSGDEGALEKQREIEAENRALSIPSPSIYEIWRGVDRSEIESGEEVKEVLGSQPTAGLEGPSARRAAEFQARLRSEGSEMGHMDALIAGIAALKGEKILTRDRDFDRISEIDVEKY